LARADCEDQVAEKEENNNDYKFIHDCGEKLALPALTEEDGFLLHHNITVYISP